MIVELKTNSGKVIDVTSIYIRALEGTITNEEYKSKLDNIKNDLV